METLKNSVECVRLCLLWASRERAYRNVEKDVATLKGGKTAWQHVKDVSLLVCESRDLDWDGKLCSSPQSYRSKLGLQSGASRRHENARSYFERFFKLIGIPCLTIVYCLNE